ncbi:MAG: DUF6048 family protein [Muribaculaceae bacterium]|nr:DUF6048 family protein [Muribaculaceae bacterium]
MRRLITIIATAVLVLVGVLSVPQAEAQRRVTPVNNAATRTQYKNDERGDSARALERRRARSTHYHDENGNIIMVDTLTGVEWTDSTLLPKAPPMKYPLMHDISVGINFWDPVMRAFGQKYGGADAWVALSLHNRFVPVFEFGMGTAKKTPVDNNYTYHGKLAPYFRLGMDYNFLYNSNPDYRIFAGVRYGFSAFKFSADGITVDDPYWGETSSMSIPSTSASAGWLEVGIGLRVKLFGPISAGWMVKYHTVLHQSHPAVGDPWYIPGYGTATSALGGSFSIIYTLPLNRKVRNVGTGSITDAPRTSAVSAPPAQP